MGGVTAMSPGTSNSISLDDVEVRPSRGRFEDGTEFYLAASGKYLITLPEEGKLGIHPHADEYENHRELREALATLTGEEFSEDQVAAKLAEGGYLVDGLARRDRIAECLQDEI